MAAGATIRAAVYPRPSYEGAPWSQWGQGIVLPDGSHLSGIGDHIGPDGNSFLFITDPESGTIQRISDVLSLTDHRAGSWGYGKLHAQMVEGPCGSVYTTTYWGTRRGLEYSGSYQGDLLLRIDPQNRTLGSLGVLEEHHGIPSLASWPTGGLAYAEAARPDADRRGRFLVHDLISGEQVFSEEIWSGFRAMAVGSDGMAYVTTAESELSRWSPTEGNLESVGRMPGSFLRAATPPAPDGTIYAVSRDPEVFFAIEPDGELRTIADAPGYTTSLAFDAGAGTVWFIPDAHGGAWERGTPLYALEVDTGDLDVLLRLQPLVGDPLGLRLGGTYNIGYDTDRNRLFIGLNGAPLREDSSFGEVVMVVVNLP